MSLKEERLDVPASKSERSEQLDWLLFEAERMFRSESPSNVWVQKSGRGQYAADSQRHEVAAIVQVAAYRANVQCSLQTTESVRERSGSRRASGAYKQLLKRPDIAARSNAQEREQYAYGHSGHVSNSDRYMLNRELGHGVTGWYFSPSTSILDVRKRSRSSPNFRQKPSTATRRPRCLPPWTAGQRRPRLRRRRLG